MQGGNSCSELLPDATRLSQLLSGWWRAHPSPGGSPGTVCPSTLKRLARPATGLQQRETPALPTQDASRKKVNFPHPCSPCSSVANRATVQHKPLFWASFLPPSFLEQFPACFTFQLLCPQPCQWKLSACVAACTGKIQPP